MDSCTLGFGLVQPESFFSPSLSQDLCWCKRAELVITADFICNEVFDSLQSFGHAKGAEHLNVTLTPWLYTPWLRKTHHAPLVLLNALKTPEVHNYTIPHAIDTFFFFIYTPASLKKKQTKKNASVLLKKTKI